MPHVVHEKQKLLNRVRRVRGQIDAIERALEAEDSCTQVMALLTAARGAINGMMAAKPTREEAQAADELIDVLRSYIR